MSFTETTISPDHPRVCGERGFALLLGRFDRGSSPRVRGTLELEPPHITPFRIIPACAGNAYRAAHTY